MNSHYTEEELCGAARTVQQTWLEKLSENSADSGTPFSDDLKDRLSESWEKGLASRGPRLRRPLFRAVAAAFAVLLILTGWLTLDKKAQAKVEDWLIKAGLKEDRQGPAMEAHNRLMAFLGGEGDTRSQYQNSPGEAYRK